MYSKMYSKDCIKKTTAIQNPRWFPNYRQNAHHRHPKPAVVPKLPPKRTPPPSKTRGGSHFTAFLPTIENECCCNPAQKWLWAGCANPRLAVVPKLPPKCTPPPSKTRDGSQITAKTHTTAIQNPRWNKKMLQNDTFSDRTHLQFPKIMYFRNEERKSSGN